jgi:hypothetical protein
MTTPPDEDQTIQEMSGVGIALSEYYGGTAIRLGNVYVQRLHGFQRQQVTLRAIECDYNFRVLDHPKVATLKFFRYVFSQFCSLRKFAV